ncbi:MAG: cofactor-independent phosphoglycerate mutase [Tannerellaceae bacterium]|jgi:2,3-bisphosphoglycerate-independent phosphoglycerate mutase|nr:cofactor-independent phosphoglycerate mutase [Tannerellaceae bacterium]
MKYIIILGDGMADEPVDILGGKTPLQYAHTPCMDMLASSGSCGLLKTIPAGFHPGSEVANMAILGYDLNRVFEGRGSLEAASMGVELHPGDMAMRCNLINVDADGLIQSHTSGHISTGEAAVLIKHLNDTLGTETVKFHAGVSYRHLLVLKGGDKRLNCTPPHDVPQQAFRPLLIKPESADAVDTAELLNSLILKSQEVLSTHPLNIRREAEGKPSANSIWPWSPGYRPAMKTLSEMYNIGKGVVISAVDLIRGIGAYAGLEIIYVEGATGLYDTNYEGKAKAAVDALKTHDFVFLHLEGIDEAGHEGKVDLKIKTIEDLDMRIVRPVYEGVKYMDEPVSIAVLPDHPTPCALRTHTAEPVPFLIYKPGEAPDEVKTFDERSVAAGKYGLLEGDRFIKQFLDYK